MKGMGTILRKYTSFDEMKADENRHWQSRPMHERMDAVEEMIQTAYALKGWVIEPDVPRLERPFVRIPCPCRQILCIQRHLHRSGTEAPDWGS
jgi:hypothetical protein